MLRFAILGAGAVGGYYGALLACAGEQVTLIARGAHLRAVRERGLTVRSPLGDFVVHPPAEEDPARVGPVDVVIYAVKTYSNAGALPVLRSLMGHETCVLTLQNGVDSAEEIAAVVGAPAVLAGATYVAAALSAPGVVEQTGSHRRIVFGEAYGRRSEISPRAARLQAALSAAGVEAEAVADARRPLWEKFVYLAPFAGITGAARLPIGPLWADPAARAVFFAAAEEVAAVAAAEGVALADGLRARIVEYTNALPASTRSSLLIDLAQGRPIEVEALHGSVVRRGQAAGVPTPVMSVLYGLLRPHAAGAPREP